jgi:hypothetical protein
MDLSERDSILKEITNLENRIEDLRQQQSDTENSPCEPVREIRGNIVPRLLSSSLYSAT